MRVFKHSKIMITTCFFLCFLSCACAQQMVTIKGNVKGDTKGYNKIYSFGKDTQSDSATIADGAFEITIPFNRPFFQQLHLEYSAKSRRGYALFGLLIDRPGIIYIKDIDIEQGMGSGKVSGMASATDYLQFSKELSKAVEDYQRSKAKKEQDAGNATTATAAATPAVSPAATPAAASAAPVAATGPDGAASRVFRPAPGAKISKDDYVQPVRSGYTRNADPEYKKAIAKFFNRFVKAHADAYVSAYVLDIFREELDPADLGKIHALLSDNMQQTSAGKNVTDYLAGLNNSKEGQTVQDFTLETPDGKSIRFSDLKGKYVLIDFWASWCGPCKASFPHLKEVYEKYKGNKFEIYSISIDKNKEAWLKESARQQLPWLQTLDTKNIAQAGFAVTAVPMTYLIGPDGKIIMKAVGFDPNGKSPLEEKLQELFGKKDAGVSFQINGEIDDVKEPAKVVIRFRKDDKAFADTVPLVDGRFSMKGAIEKPDRSMLYMIKESDDPRIRVAMGFDGSIKGRDGMMLYLDEGNISVKGATLKTATVTGSAAHKDFLVLEQMSRPVYDKLNAIEEKMTRLPADQRNGPEFIALRDQMRATFTELQPVELAFIKSHNDSYVAWNLVADMNVVANPDEYRQLLNNFSPKFLHSADGKKVVQRLDAIVKTAIGQPAPDFTQLNAEGKPVSLSSFKGKYLLLDFWASWCGPCRAENPNLVKAYGKFKEKGFEILAVSIDDKKDAWLKAIAEDRLPWIQVSDLKGAQNEAGQLYNILAVPQNFLLDKNGVIIARNLRGEALEKKLAEILN